MMSNFALNTSSFNALNESKCLSKKEIGMIGPLPTGEMKLRIPSSINTLKRTDESDCYVFEFQNYRVEIPKKCVDVSPKQGFDDIVFKTGMNWFKLPQNSEEFENVIESFIQSRYEEKSQKTNPLEEDVNLITDGIGIFDDVEKCESDSDLFLEGVLTNGMEFEFHKSSKEDPLKKIFLWKNSDNIHPSIEIRRKGSKYDCKYRTPKGIFECKHDSLSSIPESPIDKYLISVSTDVKLDDHQKDLVDHLFKLFKYHNWEKPENGSSKMERYLEETSEIKRVMEMLKNSIPEKHIEEMYTDARSKFITGK